jgi:hypothetical protein
MKTAEMRFLKAIAGYRMTDYERNQYYITVVVRYGIGWVGAAACL